MSCQNASHSGFVERKNWRTSRLNRSGASTLLRCPTPGMTTKCAPRDLMIKILSHVQRGAHIHVTIQEHRRHTDVRKDIAPIKIGERVNECSLSRHMEVG